MGYRELHKTVNREPHQRNKGSYFFVKPAQTVYFPTRSTWLRFQSNTVKLLPGNKLHVVPIKEEKNDRHNDFNLNHLNWKDNSLKKVSGTRILTKLTR